MSVTTHERPGVYSSFDASTVVDGRSGRKNVAVVGRASKGTAGQVVWVTSLEEAEAVFGPNEGGSCLVELVRLALLNGAAQAAAVAAAVGAEEPETADYQDAFAALELEDDVPLVACASTELEVQQALRQSVEQASGQRRERVAVAACGGDTVAELTERAEALNSERMVLVSPGVLRDDGETAGDGAPAAAAVAGVLAAESDPALPLGGAEVKGLRGLNLRYTDDQLDALIRGGVTSLEQVGGRVSVVRGVTTRTKSGGAADATWRELTTIRIADDVIVTVRDALRARFQRAKNTAQTRGAVRSQVVLELEQKLAREIITSYEDVRVTVDEAAPTVCLVEFSFTVAHGLNQIHLTAHITV